MKKLTLITVAMLLITAAAAAQSISNSGTTPIVATKAESISVNAAGLIPFDLGALAAQTLTINSSWNLAPGRNAVDVCVYMDPVTGVMKGTNVSNTDTIDQTYVQAKVGAAAFAAINASANCGVAAATLVKTWTLSNQADRKNANHTDTVQIQLAGVPATLQADTYTGALTVVAYSN